MKESPRKRAQRLRRLGVRSTIAAFAVAWAIVFGQLALGHDPALGGAQATQTQKAASSPATSTSQSQDQTQVPWEESPAPQQQSPAPATTAQS